MNYRLPPAHKLRWVEYLPEVGEPILDDLTWIWEAEQLLARKRETLLQNIRREWPQAQRRKAQEIAKLCPATQPTPAEFEAIKRARS